MGKIKIIAAFLVIIVGMGGAYFILKNSIPDLDMSAKNSQKSGETSNDLSQKDLLENNNNSLGATNGAGYFSQTNITKTLGDTFFSRINSQETVDKIKNDSSMGINSVSGQIASDVLAKSQADFNFITTISDSEIKITSDTSKTAKEKYLKEIGETIKKDFSNYNVIYLQVIIDTYQKLDSSSATKSAEVYGNLAKDFMGITVPADWVDVHKEIIMYYKNSEIVYKAMANYQTDPIKGYLTLDMIDSLVKQAPEIQDKLAEKAKEIQ